MTKNCDQCDKQFDNLLRCSRCQKAVYCSKEHQRAHWKIHKSVCEPQGGETSASRSSLATSSTTTSASSVSTSLSTSSSTSTSKPASVSTSSSASSSVSASASHDSGRDKGEKIDSIMSEHELFERTFDKMRAEHGLSLASMPAAFDLMNSWIGLYKLEPTDALITEVVPVCVGLGGEWHMKAIQCRAFLRYKQHRFKEALADFIEFRGLAGNSAELAENMGHTYNTLGDYAKAEECFSESLRLMDLPGAPPKSSSNRGGVLLGLGLVKERLGRPEEGLKILQSALQFYRNRFKGAEHSLVAKTLMSVGHTQEKLKRYPEAVTSYREATRIFQFTCGDDTPLTANAVFSLAKALNIQKERVEARELLQKTLELYVGFDTLHVYMPIIIEILNEAKAWSVNEEQPANVKPGPDTLAILHRKFVPLIPSVLKCEGRLKEEKVDSGTAAVFHKVAGEICMLAGQYAVAAPLLKKAIQTFQTVTEVNCSGLIKECQNMLAFSGQSE